MLRRTFFAFTLVVPFLAAACNGVTVAPRPHTSSACADLYSAYASWSQTCLGTAPDQRALDDLSAHCAAETALPGIEVTDAMLWGCADAVAASSCAALPHACLTRLGDFANPREVWLGPDSFAQYELFPRAQGTLPRGAPCDIDQQCQSGRCSSYDSCGVCVELRAFGEACDETTLCAPGSNCTDGVCVEWGDGLGAPCQVVKGSNCKASLFCQDGVCSPRLAVGDACQDGVLSDACPLDARCVDGLCKARTTAHAGEACDDAATCEDGTFCVDGECRAPADGIGEGDACGIDFCAAGLACNYGVCVPPAHAGEACSIDTPCAEGLFCDVEGAHLCRPHPAEGEPCDLWATCAPGLSCYGAPDSRCHRGEALNAPCGEGVECLVDLACRDGVCAALDACSTVP
jgi:hypothetical protein